MKTISFQTKGRAKGQKCAPVCTKNPQAYRTLASKADILNEAEVNAARYLLKLADWLESPEYIEAKAVRAHFKKLRAEKKKAQLEQGAGLL